MVAGAFHGIKTMHLTIPSNYIKVDLSDFIKFLSTCPDYKRDMYTNSARYYFVWNKEVFAYVSGTKDNEQAFINPKFLI